MGLPKAAVNLLLNESLERPFSGSIATLGRQHVYISGAEFQALASIAGVSPVPVEAQLHREPRLRACGYLSDDSLYQMLGFSRSVRIDQSAYEAAEEHLNLNAKETPAALCDAFDVVLDSGTIDDEGEQATKPRHERIPSLRQSLQALLNESPILR